MKNLLKTTFLADTLIAIAFGMYSWLFPQQTFGTMLSIPKAESSAFLAILSNLSLFYILIGLISAIGFLATYPMNIRIGLVMTIRHLSEGLLKVFDIDEEWLIGNPYPDIVIHSVFILVYILGIRSVYRKRNPMGSSGM